MSEFERLRVVTGYEFLKHIRRRRLYVILILALLSELAVIIGVPLLMDGYPRSVLIMAALLTVGPSLATIGAVFFAGDAIAGEFESKTGFILFTNPVKRITLWTGKYLASCAAVTLLVIFSYVIITITLLVIYGEVPVETAKSFGLCLLFAGSVISVTFLFSSVSKGAMGATVMTLLFIMVFCGILESILLFADKPYWYLISAGGDSIALVYSNFEVLLEDFLTHGGMGMFPFEFETPEISLTAWGMVIHMVVGFVASIWISGRRQLA